ncbi:MAG: amidase [Firmicutes bacterium]|nr:amidase [Bacillota bacterium]
MDEAVAFAPLEDLQRWFRSGHVAPVELTALLLRRIERLNPLVHAYITVAADRALQEARAAQERLARGDDAPLLGIPVAIKDNLSTQGLRTTANSRLWATWIPAHDATAVARLRLAGAVVLGKTNLNELGWSVPTDDDLCPPPRNPWNPSLAAIGSSSGSGAAVAAGLAAAALGTDGGGSVRLPAGQMGLVGLKPTHGLISRAGCFQAGTLSDVGPLVRTVRDMALVLNVLAGHDPADPVTRQDRAADYVAGVEDGVRGLRLGVPWSYVDTVPVDADVRQAYEAALQEFSRLGASLHTVDLRVLEGARAAAFVVLNAEHYAAHEATLRTHWSRYGRSARLYLAQAAFLSAADYLQARRLGTLVAHAVDRVLDQVDVVVLPTSPMVTAEAARRPEVHRCGLNASFTAPFNLTGHPALSVPCGVSRATGLPMGLQLVGRRGDEVRLLRTARALERVRPWPTQPPGVASLPTEGPLSQAPPS